MKYLITLSVLFFFSTSSFAAKVICVSSENKVSVELGLRNEILVQFNNEVTIADGLLTSEEIDIVAKFQSFGEMTLFAKIAKADPSNYIYIKGKRFSVNCR